MNLKVNQEGFNKQIEFIKFKHKIAIKKFVHSGFPGGAVVENLPANAGDTGSSPGLVRSTCCGATKPVCHNY